MTDYLRALRRRHFLFGKETKDDSGEKIAKPQKNLRKEEKGCNSRTCFEKTQGVDELCEENSISQLFEFGVDRSTKSTETKIICFSVKIEQVPLPAGNKKCAIRKRRKLSLNGQDMIDSIAQKTCSLGLLWCVLEMEWGRMALGEWGEDY